MTAARRWSTPLVLARSRRLRNVTPTHRVPSLSRSIPRVRGRGARTTARWRRIPLTPQCAPAASASRRGDEGTAAQARAAMEHRLWCRRRREAAHRLLPTRWRRAPRPARRHTTTPAPARMQRRRGGSRSQRRCVVHAGPVATRSYQRRSRPPPARSACGRSAASRAPACGTGSSDSTLRLDARRRRKTSPSPPLAPRRRTQAAALPGPALRTATTARITVLPSFLRGARVRRHLTPTAAAPGRHAMTMGLRHRTRRPHAGLRGSTTSSCRGRGGGCHPPRQPRPLRSPLRVRLRVQPASLTVRRRRRPARFLLCTFRRGARSPTRAAVACAALAPTDSLPPMAANPLREAAASRSARMATTPAARSLSAGSCAAARWPLAPVATPLPSSPPPPPSLLIRVACRRPGAPQLRAAGAPVRRTVARASTGARLRLPAGRRYTALVLATASRQQLPRPRMTPRLPRSSDA